MKKLSKNILKRSAVVAAATVVCSAAIFFSYRYMDNKTLPTVGSVNGDKPVIILDAGHGEST